MSILTNQYLKILELRDSGMTYNQIQKALGCRRDKISYAIKNKDEILKTIKKDKKDKKDKKERKERKLIYDDDSDDKNIEFITLKDGSKHHFKGMVDNYMESYEGFVPIAKLINEYLIINTHKYPDPSYAFIVAYYKLLYRDFGFPIHLAYEKATIILRYPDELYSKISHTERLPLYLIDIYLESKDVSISFKDWFPVKYHPEELDISFTDLGILKEWSFYRG